MYNIRHRPTYRRSTSGRALLSEVVSLLPLPPGKPKSFRVTVHGTCFGGREEQLSGLRAGDPLQLVVDPPVQEDPQVWVHKPSGPPVGHLPPEVNAWMAGWLRSGGTAHAKVLSVRGPEAPSWRRLVIRVECSAA